MHESEILKNAFEKECCTVAVWVWLSCPISWAQSLCVCISVWFCACLCVCMSNINPGHQRQVCFHKWGVSQQPLSIIICIFSLIPVQHCWVLTCTMKLHQLPKKFITFTLITSCWASKHSKPFVVLVFVPLIILALTQWQNDCRLSPPLFPKIKVYQSFLQR